MLSSFKLSSHSGQLISMSSGLSVQFILEVSDLVVEFLDLACQLLTLEVGGCLVRVKHLFELLVGLFEGGELSVVGS